MTLISSELHHDVKLSNISNLSTGSNCFNKNYVKHCKDVCTCLHTIITAGKIDLRNFIGKKNNSTIYGKK